MRTRLNTDSLVLVLLVTEGADHLQLPQLARQTCVQLFFLDFSLLPVVDLISHCLWIVTGEARPCS
jgi:hypothetical protein